MNNENYKSKHSKEFKNGFIYAWNKLCRVLKSSGYDLSKIYIAVKK